MHATSLGGIIPLGLPALFTRDPLQAVLSFAVQVASSATVVGMAGSAAFVVMRALQCAFTMLSKVGIIPDAAAQDMSSSSNLDDVMVSAVVNHKTTLFVLFNRAPFTCHS